MPIYPVYRPAAFNAYDNVTFPTNISSGSSGGPEYLTEITELGGGNEQPTSRQDVPKERWNVAYGVRSQEDVDELMRFFMCRRGRAGAFNFVVPNTGAIIRARFDTDYLPSRLEDYRAESATVPIVETL